MWIQTQTHKAASTEIGKSVNEAKNEWKTKVKTQQILRIQ